jgi:hypothetical protein
MKIYETLSVELSYQNIGSTWLMILRGPTKEIELTFNGLFNFCATGGELTYQNEAKTLATFWSSKEKMRKFFINRLSFSDTNSQKSKVILAADQKVKDLQQNQEIFKTFSSNNICSYSKGTIQAERPDDDFKDATWKFNEGSEVTESEESEE